MTLPGSSVISDVISEDAIVMQSKCTGLLIQRGWCQTHRETQWERLGEKLKTDRSGACTSQGAPRTASRHQQLGERLGTGGL